MPDITNKTVELSTHNYLLPRGRYAGHRITRVPVKYLFYLINSKSDLKEIAQSELARRKCPVPDIDLSAHAVDQASLRLLKRWRELGNKDEGIFSWLLRVGTQALKSGTYTGDNKIAYKKMLFVFDIEPDMPVLKTVMLNPKKKP